MEEEVIFIWLLELRRLREACKPFSRCEAEATEFKLYGAGRCCSELNLIDVEQGKVKGDCTPGDR